LKLEARIGYFPGLMTLTEKLLARAAGKASVQAGDNIWVSADVLMTHDVCGPGTIGVFKREFGKTAKVWDKNKIVIIPDHYIFTADSLSNRNVDILREFANEQGLPYFYDVIDDPKGQWKFDAVKGNMKRQYGSRYCRRLPRGTGGQGPHASWRSAVRHGFAHLHGGRVQPVRHRHRQHRRGFCDGHGQVAHQGAGNNALPPRRQVAARA